MSEVAVSPAHPPVEPGIDADAEMDVVSPAQTQTQLPPTTTAAAEAPRKRPRLDLTAGTRERRKGKSIFGLVIGTLNKAKVEDKERMASEAAKKRMSIDARLQAKLSKEQTIVRQQDESKRDRINASRKLEDIAIKDGILNHRYSVLPHLANFLITTDIIPKNLPSEPSSLDTSSPSPHPPPTSNPPALYYLPKILTPSQEQFIAQRKQQAEKRVAEEKAEWAVERNKGAEEAKVLKEKAEEARLAFLASKESAAAEEKKKADEEKAKNGVDGDEEMGAPAEEKEREPLAAEPEASIEDVPGPTPMDQDEDDAVEY